MSEGREKTRARVSKLNTVTVTALKLEAEYRNEQ
jgi:hypothetical protein